MCVLRSLCCSVAPCFEDATPFGQKSVGRTPWLKVNCPHPLFNRRLFARKKKVLSGINQVFITEENFTKHINIKTKLKQKVFSIFY
jgi:hypothetical protein